MTSSPDTTVLRGTATTSVAPYQQAVLSPAVPASNTDAAGGEAKGQVRLDDVYADEIARIREQARQEGFAAGYTEGMQAADQAIAQARAEVAAQMEAERQVWSGKMGQAAAALESAAHRLDTQTAPQAEELVEVVCQTTLALLEDLLGRELAVATTPGVDAIRRALRLVPDDVPVTVRLHPDDYATLAEADLTEFQSAVTLRPDPQVEPGGAVAEAGARRVDAQIGAALGRVRAVLTS